MHVRQYVRVHPIAPSRHGLGGATAAVGIVLLVLSLGDDDEQPVAVTPLFGPDRVGAVIGFEF